MVRFPCDEGAILGGEAPSTDRISHRWILAATILGSSLAFVDSTVVNVGLPALQSAFGATLRDTLLPFTIRLMLTGSVMRAP